MKLSFYFESQKTINFLLVFIFIQKYLCNKNQCGYGMAHAMKFMFWNGVKRPTIYGCNAYHKIYRKTFFAKKGQAFALVSHYKNDEIALPSILHNLSMSSYHEYKHLISRDIECHRFVCGQISSIGKFELNPNQIFLILFVL